MAAGNLSDIVTMARRWIVWLVLAALIGGLTSFLVTRTIPPVYRASAKLLVTQAGSAQGSDTYNQIIGAERLTRTYADLMKTHAVLDPVIARVDGLAYEALVSSVEVLPIRDTQILQLSVESTDPASAQHLTNAIAEQFIALNTALQQERFQGPRASITAQLDRLSDDLRRLSAALDEVRARPADTPLAREAKELEISRLQRELVESQSQYGNFVRTFQDLRLAESRSTNSVALVERAALPALPVKPRVWVNTALGAAAALALMLAFLVVREQLDDTISSPERLAAWTGLYPLAVVGRFKQREGVFGIGAAGKNGQNGRVDAGGREAEPYRILRTNLQFSGVEAPLRTILVTSATPGEGKTTTAVNLALALALAGQRTILVDADLRRPTIHQVLGLSIERGLTTVLLEQQPVEQYLQETPIANLWVLTAGQIPPNPSELLGSGRMRECLERLKHLKLVDYIVIDSAPTLLASDPLAVAPFVDGVILIVDSNSTRRRSIARAQESLVKVGANIVGAVLNRYAQRSDPYYYAYYEYTSRLDKETPPAQADFVTPTHSK